MPDKRELKSYVWHKEKCFFISTIERDSSAMAGLPLPRFYETMAWVYDWDFRERGIIVAQEGDGGAFEQHYRICKELCDSGEVKKETDDA